jgi:hypothetical protein
MVEPCRRKHFGVQPAGRGRARAARRLPARGGHAGARAVEPEVVPGPRGLARSRPTGMRDEGIRAAGPLRRRGGRRRRWRSPSRPTTRAASIPPSTCARRRPAVETLLASHPLHDFRTPRTGASWPQLLKSLTGRRGEMTARRGGGRRAAAAGTSAPRSSTARAARAWSGGARRPRAGRRGALPASATGHGRCPASAMARARADRRPGAGGPRRQPHGPHLHRRPVGRLPVRRAARHRLRQPAGVHRSRRRPAPERAVHRRRQPLLPAGQPTDARRARQLPALPRSASWPL